MGWGEVVIVALVIVIVLLFLLNRAARPMAEANRAALPVARPTLDAASAQQITDLVNRGQKIEAIKVLRASTGLRLKDAKDWIDDWDGGGSTD